MDLNQVGFPGSATEVEVIENAAPPPPGTDRHAKERGVVPGTSSGITSPCLSQTQVSAPHRDQVF